ncbi:MAG: xanthine phosphoribosyltransferase [Puniceicoccaceae bacterium]
MSIQLPHEKGFHISWEQLHRDSRALAWRLNSKRTGSMWKAVVAITRGGMVPSAVVARELDIRTIDTICVKSYDHQDQSKLNVMKLPEQSFIGKGEDILIVDDLVDTSKTLKHVRELYPNAHFATVYAKPNGANLVDTFVTEVSQDTWIFFPWDMALQYVVPFRGKD